MTPKQKKARIRNWAHFQLRQVEGILNSVEDNPYTTEKEKMECMRAKYIIRNILNGRAYATSNRN